MEARQSRRAFLRTAAVGAAVFTAGCAPKVVEKIVKETVIQKEVVKEVVKETVVVQGTPQVVEKAVEKIVTAVPAPKPKVQLAIYGFQGAALEPVFAALAPKFMAKFPNIDVLSKAYAAAPGETEERMITRLAAGERPDSMWLHTLRTYEFVRLGVLERLNDEATYMGYTDIEKAIYPQMIQRMKLDMQGIYLMPNCIDIHCPNYNLDMVAKAGLDPSKPPTTWDEYVNWLKKLKGQGKWPVDMLLYTAWAIMLYLASYPGMYTDSIVTIADTDQYKSLLTSAPVIDTIKLFKDLYNQGLVATEAAAPGASFFIDGLVPIAFYPANRGFADQAKRIGDKFKWEPMGYPLPPGAKKKEPAVTGVGDGMGQVIFRIAEHKPEVWEWIKFCTSVDGEAEFGRVYYTPARQDMDNHPYLKEGIPQHAHAIALAKNGIPRVGMEYTRAEALIQTAYQQVILENKPIEAAFQTASDAFDKLLKDVQAKRSANK
jgi:ABC-type glycerol-3-phosphate transport system substrate-binding protein